MGLDIYFEKREKSSNKKPVEVAYFRKVNFLVRFFNYDLDDGYKPITKGEIIELLDRCDIVLRDHTKADELLPTQEGFFFGNCNYDDSYFQNVEEVRKFCTKVIETINFNEEKLLMYCSW